jgi:beta-aspartyl-peptidase (threonine type)
MPWFSVLIVLFLGMAVLGGSAAAADVRPVLVIHGGTTSRPQAKTTPEQDRRYRTDLDRALRAGYAVLERSSGTSLDAVEEAVRVLEDSPWFNAGKGSVFTHDGRNELDAAIMDGVTHRAGAVAGITRIKNPISAARAVMDKSKHVLLIGPGADHFAAHQGLEEVSPVYFWTPERWRLLQDDMEKERGQHRGQIESDNGHLGTVGAVALDRAGRLAAATSTGGTSNKLPGRVGDSPIIGGGTFADERIAVSATGHGEVFIRYCVAHDIASRIKYKNESVAEAAKAVVQGLPDEPDGAGGVIALDGQGNYAMPYRTKGMLRGVIREGKIEIAIYEK